MPKQLEFKKVNGWGGKRRGAGRPNTTGLVSHGKRERVNFKKPLHITMRLEKGVANLRTRKIMWDFRRAIAGAKRFGFHVIHYSILNNHIHMIVEAKDSMALASGMKSLSCRFAKAIRRIVGGSGRVFAGRFHHHLLNTPTEMKRALEYVLLNHAKHAKLIEHIDEFSSAAAFKEWNSLIGKKMNGFVQEQLAHVGQIKELSLPQSWLCSVGWIKAP
jgi:REP element-mobilizing transposase RayT